MTSCSNIGAVQVLHTLSLELHLAAALSKLRQLIAQSSCVLFFFSPVKSCCLDSLCSSSFDESKNKQDGIFSELQNPLSIEQGQHLTMTLPPGKHCWFYDLCRYCWTYFGICTSLNYISKTKSKI